MEMSVTDGLQSSVDEAHAVKQEPEENLPTESVAQQSSVELPKFTPLSCTSVEIPGFSITFQQEEETVEPALGSVKEEPNPMITGESYNEDLVRDETKLLSTEDKSLKNEPMHPEDVCNVSVKAEKEPTKAPETPVKVLIKTEIQPMEVGDENLVADETIATNNVQPEIPAVRIKIEFEESPMTDVCSSELAQQEVTDQKQNSEGMGDRDKCVLQHSDVKSQAMEDARRAELEASRNLVLGDKEVDTSISELSPVIPIKQEPKDFDFEISVETQNDSVLGNKTNEHCSAASENCDSSKQEVCDLASPRAKVLKPDHVLVEIPDTETVTSPGTPVCDEPLASEQEFATPVHDEPSEASLSILLPSNTQVTKNSTPQLLCLTDTGSENNADDVDNIGQETEDVDSVEQSAGTGS